MAKQQSSRWEDVVETESSAGPPNTPLAWAPPKLTVKITNGAWFGVAMGIGFAIGFLISFLCLVGFVGFVIMSKYPGLIS
jgi:hypothetical protein